MRLLLVLFLGFISISSAFGAAMKMYEKANSNGPYKRVLVAVSSTVIPIDDLPSYQVGVGLGVKGDKPNPEGKVKKPEGDIKLVTANKKANLKKSTSKKIFKKAGVEEITN